MTTRVSGLWVRVSMTKSRDTRDDLPSCGGMLMISLPSGVSRSRTSSRSIRSSAGVDTVRGSMCRASAPGVSHLRVGAAGS